MPHTLLSYLTLKRTDITSFVLAHTHSQSPKVPQILHSSITLTPICVGLLLSFDYFTHTHTHTHITAFFLVLPYWYRLTQVIWILLKQETSSGSGISRAICKSAPRSRQITMPVPHHSVFYRPDALPAAQPTASKH